MKTKEKVNIIPTQHTTNIQNISNTPNTQTWSEYVSPFFTWEYYYAGQIVTTVAVVLTATVAYYYIAPAIAGYYSMPAETKMNNSIDVIKPIKPFIKKHTVLESEINNHINAIKAVANNPIEKAEKQMELVDIYTNYIDIIKQTKIYNINELKEIKKMVIGSTNDYCSDYVKSLKSQLYKKTLEKFFEHHSGVRKLSQCDNALTEAVAVKRLQNIAVLNIEERAHIDPEILQELVENLNKIEPILPPQLQYLTSIMIFAYNASASYHAAFGNKYYEIKGSDIQ